jgi:hypothetical protein
MNLKLYFPIILVLVVLLLPGRAPAQSHDDISLGDLARSLRRSKGLPTNTVIDNDNMSQILDEVESRRLRGGLLFSVDGLGRNFQVSSPDVTCSLSFSAQSTSLIAAPAAPQNLPESDLRKLEGPATITGDTLQISVYNGTTWTLKEITVGLTILRQTYGDTAYSRNGQLVPAAAMAPVLAEKRPDMTVLLRLRGVAVPFTNAVFREILNSAPNPDQDWHWSIVEAKGIPPQ